MRDILLLLIIAAVLPYCVYRPWIGILAWSWLGYMNPHRLTWGFTYGFPFAQIVALATLAGLAWYVMNGRGLKGFFAGFQLKILLLLWFVFLISTLTAQFPDVSWQDFDQISKIILFTFLTAFLIDDKKKLRYLLFTITFSIGFYGIKGGVFSILTAGQYRVWGPAGSFIEDNNALALGLNMTLPFMFYLARIEKKTWLRYLLYSTFVLSLLAVLFTYSRGGFVGLAVVLGCMFLTFRFRWKMALAAVALLSFPIVISQLPDKWIDRMLTIQTYEEDGSAMSRLEAWKAAWNLAVDRPLTGGGFEVLNDRDTFIAYNPDVLSKVQEHGETTVHISGVHSVYLELLVENGFPGLIVFLIMCVSVVRTCSRLSRQAPDENTETRLAYSRMLLISLVAYLTCGTFLEMVSFDLFYQIVALSVIVERLYGPGAARPAIAERVDTAATAPRSTQPNNAASSVPANRPRPLPR